MEHEEDVARRPPLLLELEHELRGAEQRHYHMRAQLLSSQQHLGAMAGLHKRTMEDHSAAHLAKHEAALRCLVAEHEQRSSSLLMETSAQNKMQLVLLRERYNAELTAESEHAELALRLAGRREEALDAQKARLQQQFALELRDVELAALTKAQQKDAAHGLLMQRTEEQHEHARHVAEAHERPRAN